VRACLVLAAQADGTTVRTIEGLAAGADLHPVQVACLEAMSFQCGFCTPGFLMTMVALLEEHPTLEGVSLREELAGNLCRCTGYQSIVDGLELAVKRSSAGVAEGKG
jgi:carbon-monoxide dehydrogenase small subunit